MILQGILLSTPGVEDRRIVFKLGHPEKEAPIVCKSLEGMALPFSIKGGETLLLTGAWMDGGNEPAWFMFNDIVRHG